MVPCGGTTAGCCVTSETAAGGWLWAHEIWDVLSYEIALPIKLNTYGWPWISRSAEVWLLVVEQQLVAGLCRWGTEWVWFGGGCTGRSFRVLENGTPMHSLVVLVKCLVFFPGVLAGSQVREPLYHSVSLSSWNFGFYKQYCLCLFGANCSSVLAHEISLLQIKHLIQRWAMNPAGTTHPEHTETSPELECEGWGRQAGVNPPNRTQTATVQGTVSCRYTWLTTSCEEPTSCNPPEIIYCNVGYD